MKKLPFSGRKGGGYQYSSFYFPFLAKNIPPTYIKRKLGIKTLTN